MKDVNRIVLATAVVVCLVLLGVGQMRPVKAQGPMFAIGAQRAPSLAIDKNNNVFLAVSTATKPPSAGTPGSQTFFMESTDGGFRFDNFPKTENLSNSRGEAFGPSMAISSNGKPKAYIVYQDNADGTTQAFLIRSKKNANFKGPQRITPNGNGAFSPKVAVDSNGSVNVVWGETIDLGKQVTFIRSDDSGVTFEPTVNVSNSAGDAFAPSIAVDNADNIDVVWEDTAPGTSSIFFSKSTDHGLTFSAPVQVSQGPGEAHEAQIADDPAGGINIIWIDASVGGNQVFFARSTDSGATFSAPVNVSGGGPQADCHQPAIATFANQIFIAYNNDNVSQVFLTSTTTGSPNRFSDTIQVSKADPRTGHAHNPSIALDGKGVLHIAWIDDSIIGSNEGLLLYSNTADGKHLASFQMLFCYL